jgi:hypothetical protein
VYFPEGRVPGAPFVVTHPSDWPWGGISARLFELNEIAGGAFNTSG